MADNLGLDLNLNLKEIALAAVSGWDRGVVYDPGGVGIEGCEVL
jgi:hypothetical protein